MLDRIFLQILNMSFTASFVILFVLVARLFLKKSAKVFSYALWGIVLFRLICPLSFESVFSFLPVRVEPISQDIVYMNIPKIDTGITTINHAINSSLPAATPHASVNPLQIWVFLGRIIWLGGIAILLVYSIVSLMKFKKCLRCAVHKKDNIYIAEKLDTPFVMGIAHPKIYLPATLGAEEEQYILLHEQMHIRRFDHIIKILSFLVLCLHWFNPLVWVAFFISGRDMEMSCDEAVIKQLGGDVKKEYSSSLLALATGRRIIGGTPLAFGEGDTKGRIKNVLNYKKSGFWAIVATVIVIIIIGIGLTTNPINSVRLPEADDINLPDKMLDRVIHGTQIAGDRVMDFSEAKVPEYVDFIKELRVSRREVSKDRGTDRDSTNQIYLAYRGLNNNEIICDLYFNFNTDFTEIWLDNGIKPRLSYRVKKPGEVRDFFERQFGSITRIREISSVEELIDYFETSEIDANIQNLVITTPRDSFSPFMSSMFGFELVLNAPENSAKFVYTCDKGSFCTYKDAKIEHIGNNVTTNETVYWWPFKEDEHMEEMDKTLVSVTALDKNGEIIAFGTATIEHSSEDGWFRFVAEAP